MRKIFHAVYNTSHTYLSDLTLHRLAEPQVPPDGHEYYNPITVVSDSWDRVPFDEFMQHFIDNKTEFTMYFTTNQRYGGWNRTYNLTPYTMDFTKSMVLLDSNLIKFLVAGYKLSKEFKRSLDRSNVERISRQLLYISLGLLDDFYSNHCTKSIHHLVYWYLLSPCFEDPAKVARWRTNITSRLRYENLSYRQYTPYTEDCLHNCVTLIFRHYVLLHYHTCMINSSTNTLLKLGRPNCDVSILHNYVDMINSYKNILTSTYDTIYKALFAKTNFGKSLEDLRLHGCNDVATIVSTTLDSADKHVYNHHYQNTRYPDTNAYKNILTEGGFNFNYSNAAWLYHDWVSTVGRNRDVLRVPYVNSYYLENLDSCRQLIMSDPVAYLSFALEITNRLTWNNGGCLNNTRFKLKTK